MREAAHGALRTVRGLIHPMSSNPCPPAVRFAPRVREAARGVLLLHAAGGPIPFRINNCSTVFLMLRSDCAWGVPQRFVTPPLGKPLMLAGGVTLMS